MPELIGMDAHRPTRIPAKLRTKGFIHFGNRGGLHILIAVTGGLRT
jgi:hypothetical protein